MTMLQWDQVGSRRFESGCDRGVLYLPDGSAVPWNGLTSVTDDTSDSTVEEYFLDGVKYLNRKVVADYSGTLKAFTYPDEFLQFEGLGDLQGGISATGQPVNQTFGLSYRTKLGNDLHAESGYKIHLLYNLTAKPDTKSYSTVASNVTPETFSWTLSGVPIYIPSKRPSVHIIIDSTKLSGDQITVIENYLYGSSTQSPMLPDAQTLISFQPSPGGDLISEPIGDIL